MDGTGGGPKGDIFLTVKLSNHTDFHRKGNDLHRSFPVELYTAILGGKALVKTLKGAVKVDIPKGTPNGKELRLHGLGMPVFGKLNTAGDLFVTVDVVLPENLGVEETALFEKLATFGNK